MPTRQEVIAQIVGMILSPGVAGRRLPRRRRRRRSPARSRQISEKTEEAAAGGRGVSAIGGEPGACSDRSAPRHSAVAQAPGSPNRPESAITQAAATLHAAHTHSKRNIHRWRTLQLTSPSSATRSPTSSSSRPSQLRDYLKEKYKIEPAAGGGVMMAAAAGRPRRPRRRRRRPSSRSCSTAWPTPTKKISVIKVVREITGLRPQGRPRTWSRRPPSRSRKTSPRKRPRPSRRSSKRAARKVSLK